MTIEELLGRISYYILNPLITLLFAVATLILFWGIFQFINSETADSKREKGKLKIMYGLIGMFVMISAYGLIRLILGTFGINPPSYPGF